MNTGKIRLNIYYWNITEYYRNWNAIEMILKCNWNEIEMKLKWNWNEI